MYCTPEAVQYHKCNKVDKEVQYTGTFNLTVPVIFDILNSGSFKFKKEFWENNKNYICQEGKTFNFKEIIKYHFYNFDRFPTKYNIEKIQAHNGSKYIFLLNKKAFVYHKESIYKFIKEVIFKNPISSLC
jgi:hypothetical protein